MDVPWAIPLMQAPIGPAATPELVAAVSRTGALGTLAASWTDPHVLGEQIRQIAASTDQPFCVNLVLAFDQHDRLEVVIEEGVSVVSFSWGIDDAMISRAHEGGAAVLVQVGGVAEAKRAEAAGADLVMLQGVEAGGHVQSATPLHDLLPAVRTAVGRPIIAAGGIGDHHGVRRALAAGADAVACGTAFLAAHEADVHPRYLDRLIRAGADDTILTRLFDGGWPDAPHRVIRNETVVRWEEAGAPLRGARPGEDDVVALRRSEAVVRYADAQPTRDTTGDIGAMAMYAGHSVDHIERSEPAASIVGRLAQGLDSRESVRLPLTQ
jgi:NAD(P)H-dependent flavin oxidoreductase YrpB (nitropropane dioxygenase family)